MVREWNRTGSDYDRERVRARAVRAGGRAQGRGGGGGVRWGAAELRRAERALPTRWRGT